MSKSSCCPLFNPISFSFDLFHFTFSFIPLLPFIYSPLPFYSTYFSKVGQLVSSNHGINKGIPNVFIYFLSFNASRLELFTNIWQDKASSNIFLISSNFFFTYISCFNNVYFQIFNFDSFCFRKCQKQWNYILFFLSSMWFILQWWLFYIFITR